MSRIDEPTSRARQVAAKPRPNPNASVSASADGNGNSNANGTATARASASSSASGSSSGAASCAGSNPPGNSCNVSGSCSANAPGSLSITKDGVTVPAHAVVGHFRNTVVQVAGVLPGDVVGPSRLHAAAGVVVLVRRRLVLGVGHRQLVACGVVRPLRDGVDPIGRRDPSAAGVEHVRGGLVLRVGLSFDVAVPIVGLGRRVIRCVGARRVTSERVVDAVLADVVGVSDAELVNVGVVREGRDVVLGVDALDCASGAVDALLRRVAEQVRDARLQDVAVRGDVDHGIVDSGSPGQGRVVPGKLHSTDGTAIPVADRQGPLPGRVRDQ